MDRSDPSALRWLVGNELHQFRMDARRTAAAAGEAAGLSYSTVAHIESARLLPRPEVIAKLMRFYDADQYEIDRITTLSGQSDGKTWWAPWSHVIPDWSRTFVGLEGLAAAEFAYSPIAIPGLLQTADFARELSKATAFVRPDHSERFASFRQARAKRLTAPEPLHLHAVIGETTLRTHVGTPEVRRAQYQHLIEMAELPNVTFQILRPENGPHAANAGPFTVLDFTYARSAAYAEVIEGAVYVQDQDEVRSYTAIADNLRQVASSPEESLAFVVSLLEDV